MKIQSPFLSCRTPLAAIVCVSSVVSCTTYGTVTVSDPQVFTRERLIQERYDEYQWMGRQLEMTPTKARLQGLRDLRVFTGIHNKLAVQFDPLQGAADALSQKGRILDAETANLKKQLEKEKADRALREYITGSSSSTQATNTMESNGTGETKPSSQAPSSSTNNSSDGQKGSADLDAGEEETKSRLAQIRKDLGELPKSSQAEKINDDLQTGIADLFHDQLAYRSIVRAAMREKQLDDSHDLFGSMLYDLQFDITLQPGDHSDRYAKVMLELKEPPCTEEQQSETDRSTTSSSHPGSGKKAMPGICPGFYRNYVQQLQRQVAARIVTLQKDYRRGELSSHDKNWLDQSIKFLLPKVTTTLAIEAAGATSEIKRAAGKIKADLNQTPEEKKTELKKQSPALDFNADVDVLGNAISLLKALPETVLLDTSTVRGLRNTAQPKPEDKCASWTGIEKALCLAPDEHKQSLLKELDKGETKDTNAKTVETEIVKLSGYFNSRHIDDVLDPSSVHMHGNAVNMAIVWAVWNQYEALKDFVTVSSPPSTNDNLEPATFPFIFSISEGSAKGEAAFLKRLENTGNRMVAVSIEPKEYAQNISDVAAQERLVSLVMQLKATFPQYGITADNYSEYVNRTQEFVQAINRRPLAIGYGGGSNKFGWILGPKFAISQPPPLLSKVKNLFTGYSLVQFSHAPVRHTFRASVVVPAWWDSVNMEAKSRWIDFNGDAVDVHSGWIKVDRDSSSTQLIKAALPKPPESWIAITEALLRSDQDSQPKPRISYPDPKRTGRNSLQLREYDHNAEETHHQTLLIEGEDLWRSPEVYVGAVKASHVHIAPDMKGLYAVFDFRKNMTEPTKSTLLPKLIDKGSMALDLMVVTSGGRDVVPNGVTYVAKTRAPEAVSQPVTLTQAFVIGKNGPITFRVNDLGGHHSLGLNVRPASKAKEFWTSKADLNWSESRTQITTNLFKVVDKEGQVKELVTQELELRVLVKRFADAKEEDVLTKDNRTIVYFAQDAHSKFELPKNTLTFRKDMGKKDTDDGQYSPRATEDLELRVPLDDNALFYKAYPGLKEAVKKGNGGLAVVLEGGADTTIMQPLSFEARFAPAREGEKRDKFYIPKSALDNRIRDLTVRDGDKFNVSVQFGDTTIRTTDLLTLKVQQ